MCGPGSHAKPPMALIATESTTCGLVFRAAGERPVTAPFIGAQVVLGVLRVREGRFHSPSPSGSRVSEGKAASPVDTGAEEETGSAGRHAASANNEESSHGTMFFPSTRARLSVSRSAAIALLQLLTGVPSGHDDSGTADLSYRVSSGFIAITSRALQWQYSSRGPPCSGQTRLCTAHQ